MTSNCYFTREFEKTFLYNKKNIGLDTFTSCTGVKGYFKNYMKFCKKWADGLKKIS
jgi:hypothetical protein